MSKKRKTNAERQAARERARANGEWVRELLVRAEAELPSDQRRPPGASNGEWLLQLAEKGKAELDAREQQET